MMLKIGLTGGIACGKTTITKEFSKLGAPVIDADIITRELMRPDTELSKKIIEHFGTTILDKNGELNRTKLGDIVFNDATEKKWLESLIHPAVRQVMTDKIKNINYPYCILAIPLLVETLPNPLVDRILVIDCNDKLQLQRLQTRDNLNKEQAQNIISQQSSRQARLKLANDVIDNDSDLKTMAIKVNHLHKYYLELAKQQK